MLLLDDPYIRFSPNTYTDPLVENWETIRNQYWDFCQHMGHRRDGEWDSSWLDKTALDKVNPITQRFKEKLYTGRFKGVSIYLRESLADYHEKRAMNWRQDEKERWWPERCALMPWISDYTKRFHDVVGAVTFNTSFPDSKLNHHWGLDPEYIRIHLCLEQAAGCKFNIEGWEKEWKDGDVFGFDDANVFHGTRHDGTKPRTIMLIDIKKLVMFEHCKNWPCRPYGRPPESVWPDIIESCKDIKAVV